MAKRKKSGDDLQKIEGIGPVIARTLADQGISTFRKLAQTPVSKLREILEQVRGAHDPSTWREQASLARDGKWGALQRLQSKLDGGRRTSSRKSARAKSQSRQSPQRSEGVEQRQPPSATVVFSGVDGEPFQSGQPFVIERVLTDEEAQREYEARRQELDEKLAVAKQAIEELLAPWDRKINRRRKHEDAAQQVCRLVREGVVTAVSARFRTKFGQPVSPLQVVIAINVHRKLAAERVQQRDLLPRSYQGIPIKVLEGTFRLLDDTRGHFLRSGTAPANPLPFDQAVLGGVPIAPEGVAAEFGTLGVVHRTADAFLGLTCQHVVAGEPGDPLLQLGPPPDQRSAFVVDDRVPPDERHVAYGDFVESVDAATVKLNEDGTAIVLPPDGTWTREISVPDQNSAPLVFGNRDLRSRDRHLPLWKFGNGSGEKTEGRISMLRHDRVFIGQRDYKNNFTISRFLDAGRSFATGGDSGSVLVLEAQARIEGTEQACFVVVGILFAALEDTTVGLGCTMVRVLKALNLADRLPTVDDWFPRSGVTP